MYDMNNEIIVCNSTKTKDIKDIEKAIEKLKMQEKKLVDLYLSSTLNVETINHKNDVIKKEYVIDMIKDMDSENKLKLAICMCDNYGHTNLEYDKKEMYEYFDKLLKEINLV